METLGLSALYFTAEYVGEGNWWVGVREHGGTGGAIRSTLEGIGATLRIMATLTMFSIVVVC